VGEREAEVEDDVEGLEELALLVAIW